MSILKDTFGNEKRWVNWKLQKMKDKMTKIPYAVNGRKASSTDANTWATYERAKKASDNIGIVFTPAQDLLGIDIDHCLKNNKIDHEQKETIASLILEADTYTEISPSGEGLHLLLKIDGTLALTSNKRAPFEAYTSGRYFTVTENPYGEARDVRTVTPDEAIKLLNIIGYPWKDKKEEVINISPELSTKGDKEIVEMMFKSKNGTEIRALYGGDITGHENDASRADAALCAHLAFWTKKNAAQIERIWTTSPLGQREKTQKRKDYRARTVTNAVANCKEVYQPGSERMETATQKAGLDLLYVLNDKGNKIFVQNTENMTRVLHGHSEFIGRFRYDAFKNVYEYRPKDKWRTLEDNDAVIVQTRISTIFPAFFRVGKDMIYDAIIKVAKENTFDSASDYVKSIKWDGEARLDQWLTYTYGTPNDAYHKAVASNWLKGLIKRIVEPGCKFDYVLVLEGEQGSKKSTSLHVLGGNWHVETTMSTDSKDFFMQMQGKAIVEFSEGETLSRTEVKRMKAIITMQSDKYRPPYERVSQDFPRRCVFAMTTNQEEYLKDETGNRRWLPIKVMLPQANVEWLKQNRDQLFAEAYHRVVVKEETVYEFPKDETEAQQQARRITDPNTEIIVGWYYNTLDQAGRDHGITVHQVYTQALGNVFGKELTKWQEMNIIDVLKTTLRLDKRKCMVAGVRATRWYELPENKLNRTADEEVEAFMVQGF